MANDEGQPLADHKVFQTLKLILCNFPVLVSKRDLSVGKNSVVPLIWVAMLWSKNPLNYAMGGGDRIVCYPSVFTGMMMWCYVSVCWHAKNSSYISAWEVDSFYRLAIKCQFIWQVNYMGFVIPVGVFDSIQRPTGMILLAPPWGRIGVAVTALPMSGVLVLLGRVCVNPGVTGIF